MPQKVFSSIELAPPNRIRKEGRPSKVKANSSRKVTFAEGKENAVRMFHSLLPAENNNEGPSHHRDVLRDLKNIPSHMVLRPLPGKA